MADGVIPLYAGGGTQDRVHFSGVVVDEIVLQFLLLAFDIR
jgi:hypothetical protein